MKYVLLLFTIFVTLVTAEENTKVIAFAQDTMSNDFRKAQVFEAKDSASKYKNINFIYSDAQGQTSLLIKQIDKFMIDKYNPRVEVLIEEQ